MNKLLLLCSLVILSLFSFSGSANAICLVCGCDQCKTSVKTCTKECGTCSEDNETNTNNHFTAEVEMHKKWMIEVFWLDAVEGDDAGLLAALQLMTNQLTANAMQQVQIIGSFFDAKHQLETQRLFQTLTTRAHKDYHPSEELCVVGTATRPLAASERRSTITSTAISKRSIDRQLLSKHTLEMTDGIASDQRSRLAQFIKNYCNPNDNSANLTLLCSRAATQIADRNKDINYTATVDTPLTLDIDFTDPGVTSDERAFFALTANLIANETMPNVPADILMTIDGAHPSYEATSVAYLDSRALVAKRSVAANSLATIAALKSKGNPEAKPFIYSILHELSPGYFTEDAIAELIGTDPSYYAQMDVLTKKIYQNPKFYSDLYDKPANVLRKDVAIQATELMQKRDIFRSFLRSEAVLAVMLETALLSEQEKITNELDKGKEGGDNRTDALGGN